MRCTQIYGLPAEAVNYLKENVAVVPRTICPKCGEVIDTKWDSEDYKDETGYGMFGDGPMLRKHHLKDGGVALEEIQAVPWSSGPCIFLKLILPNGDEITWNDEEMEAC